MLHVNFGLLEEECCRASFLRGVFLAGGSSTDPQKRYHLELATSHQQAGRELAKLTGVDLEQYANAMFEAGGDVTGRTAEEVFNTDYKIFNSGEVRFGVGQGSYLTEKNRKASEALIGPYLQTALEKQGLDYIFYMFTDVRNSSTELLMAGKGAESLVEKAFDTTVTDGMAVLPGVISRKKQMVPVLINAIKQERG